MKETKVKKISVHPYSPEYKDDTQQDEDTAWRDHKSRNKKAPDNGNQEFENDNRYEKHNSGQKRNSLATVVNKLKYNREFYEKDASESLRIRLCAAYNLGIPGVKHVLLPWNSSSRRQVFSLVP